MKIRYTKLIILCIISIICIKSKSQKVDSTSLKQLSDQITELSNRISKLGKDTSEQVCIVKMLDSVPSTIYINSVKTGRTILIDKISLLIQDGYITKINVFSGDKQFINMHAPISLSETRFSKSDFLQCTTNGDESLKLNEILFFHSFKSYLPADGLVWLISNQKSDTLSRGVGINTILDLRLYSDILGLLNKPNAILQTDVRFKQILNRGNKINTGLIWFHYIKINFNTNKFDSKYNVVLSDSGVFSRSSLLQKSNINAEVILNGLHEWLGKRTLNSFYLDFGFGINNSNIGKRDTSTKIIDTLSVLTQNVFSEVGFNFKNSSNSGFDLYARITKQFSPQTDFNNQNKSLVFFKLGGEVYWNPFNDISSRIFGRIDYTFSPNKNEIKKSFLQIQFGYSVLLSKLMGK